MNTEAGDLNISGPPTSGHVTVNQVPRELNMHSVTEEELWSLRAVGPTTAVAFLGVFIGATVTFWTVLETPGLSAATRDKFDLALKGSLILTAFFAIITVVGYWHLRDVVNRVRERPPTTGTQ